MTNATINSVSDLKQLGTEIDDKYLYIHNTYIYIYIYVIQCFFFFLGETDPGK